MTECRWTVPSPTAVKRPKANAHSVHDEDVQPITLSELKPGDFFGELAVLDKGDRSANATAMTDRRSCQSTLAKLTFRARLIQSVLSVGWSFEVIHQPNGETVRAGTA
jgi:hypothetical protein